MAMAGALFGTDGIRGKANLYPMTAKMALKIGRAAGITFQNGHQHKCKVVIGKDTRLSGYMLEFALAAGILSTGVEVYFLGPMPTPAIAHLTKSFAADGGVVISASHNPYYDNGIKFFDKEGFKLADEVEEKIETLALNGIDTDHIAEIGQAHRVNDARGRYIEFAKNSIRNRSLEGITVVLDCANGATYHITKYILTELGAKVVLKNANPDGKNINEYCGAMHPELLKEDVLREKADAAIALDGDGDRLIMLDELGNVINGDKILAIAAIHLKKSGSLHKNTIVATPYSNLGLIQAMEEQGINVVLVQTGDRYVIEEMRRGDYNLGGEQSGHIIFADHSTTGDGTISALQILQIMKESGHKLSELSSIFTDYPQVLLNVRVSEKKPLDDMPTVVKIIKGVEQRLGKWGRVFVRYSGTEPLLRIMVEGKNKLEIEQYAQEIAAEVKKMSGYDGCY
ncbi:phosphoglucosamine mutase [Candidatus Woesearchaeota archaeon]|nr:phosphoglucosamine mutase [Candidatus Woesearchaeota archaeon]